jgi:hypothetical protein
MSRAGLRAATGGAGFNALPPAPANIDRVLSSDRAPGSGAARTSARHAINPRHHRIGNPSTQAIRARLESAWFPPRGQVAADKS